MDLASLFPGLSSGVPTADPLSGGDDMPGGLPMLGGTLPTFPTPPGGAGLPASMPASMPQPQKKAGFRDVLAQLAPIALAAFSQRGNPTGMLAFQQGMMQGQQVRAREAASKEQDAQKRRDAATEFMQKAAIDAQQFDTPEQAAQYLQYAESLITRIDPSFQPGTLTRGVPINADRMLAKKATATQKAAAGRVEELKKTYGENFDSVADQASVTFNGKPMKVSDLMALAELNLSTGQGPVSTLKPTKPEKAAATTDYGDFLARWAKDHGKTPDTITAADEVQAKKAWGQADDRPADPTLQAIRELTLAQQKNAAANKPAIAPAVQRRIDIKTRGFEQLPIVKKTQTMAEAVSFANSLDPQTKNPADDQALIYAFAKAMDPESVVREGEYATVQKYAQSWAQSFGFNAARVFTNVPFLTPDARKNMKTTIQSRFSAARGQYDNVRRSYAEQINRITGTLDGDDYLTDFGAAFPGAPSGGGPAPAGAKAAPATNKPATLRFNPATGKVEPIK